MLSMYVCMHISILSHTYRSRSAQARGRAEVVDRKERSMRMIDCESQCGSGGAGISDPCGPAFDGLPFVNNNNGYK